jgi:Carboxypeptidase regulatory-like domain
MNRLILRLFLGLLLADAAARAQTDSVAEQKSADISGIVTNSLTGEPLVHARVFLESGNGAEGQDCLSKTCPHSITAADGRFAIARVVPGKYQLIVERRGFGPLADEQENRKTLEVKSGEEIKDIVLELVPDAVISGRVRDEKGVPVERFWVEAAGGGSNGWSVTDDRGEFRIGGLRAGKYLVKTERLSHSEDGRVPPEIRTDDTKEIYYSPTYYPSSLYPDSASPVEARAGEETSGIEIKLAPAPILRVSGTISNVPQGADRVSVSLDGGYPYRFFNSEGPGFTFTFWRVLPGRYRVAADCVDEVNRRMPSPTVEINVTNSSIEGIDLGCAQQLELTGHVEIEAGAPIPDQKGRTPSLKFLRMGSMYYTEPGERINPDGTFKITNATRGRYHLIGEDFPNNVYVKSAHVGTADLKDGILDLRNIDPKAELTIQLGDNGAVISGVVRDAKGPAPGARVALFFDDEYGFDVAAAVTAGIDGSYALHGIAPGKYKLVAYDAKSAAVVWSSDAVALHAAVTENVDASEGDKVLRDLKLLPSP